MAFLLTFTVFIFSSDDLPYILYVHTVDRQWLEADGSLTTAVSNSFLSPLEKIPNLQLLHN